MPWKLIQAFSIHNRMSCKFRLHVKYECVASRSEKWSQCGSILNLHSSAGPSGAPPLNAEKDRLYRNLWEIDTGLYLTCNLHVQKGGYSLISFWMQQMDGKADKDYKTSVCADWGCYCMTTQSPDIYYVVNCSALISVCIEAHVRLRFWVLTLHQQWAAALVFMKLITNALEGQ